MIVACPKCQSKYNLPEEKIAPTGSKVRCARCKHVFTVMPPGKDFDREFADLSAAEPRPAPKPAPASEQPAAAPKKMPWNDDEPAAASVAPAPKKMPWDDDEPAAGPSDADDDGLPGAPASRSPFADDAAGAGTSDDDGDDGGDDDAPSQAVAGKGRFDMDAGAPASAKSGEDDFLNSLGGSSLDAKPKAQKSKKKFIVTGVIVVLLALIAGGLIYFKPWTKMNIPFLGSAKKETVENADKVKDIALRNVRQYYIPNEKAGNIFVVEGKAVNNFTTPKERIKVEISLFDEKGHVLASKQLLCGNTLSQFQLQVQSEEEIGASLGSEVGILTSNTYLKTGMDTPFMAVFFKPPDTVKEFGVKVIDALDPK
ncbi:MAG: hypothetical protein AUJ49_07200 [Desulfovibrionaceae bacterium CG1_02_65_16]|nr:MAG: hypothetical protein AUJ49_07200 [Desulfovibrionaceae bacterium CG1_02_65_16]